MKIYGKELLILKKKHDIEVFLCIEHEMLTRPKIHEKTGLARTTIFDALRRLENLGLIIKEKETLNSRGRPWMYFGISAEALDKYLITWEGRE